MDLDVTDLWFWGPGFRSARQALCGDASGLFLDHLSKHLSSVLERTELCHEVRNSGPQKPQIQRTPWGGGGERGGRKTSRMTPLPKRVLDPPRTVRFPRVVALFFLRADQKLFFEGSRIFRESLFSGTFSSPHTFAPPHITAQTVL